MRSTSGCCHNPLYIIADIAVMGNPLDCGLRIADCGLRMLGGTIAGGDHRLVFASMRFSADVHVGDIFFAYYPG